MTILRLQGGMMRAKTAEELLRFKKDLATARQRSCKLRKQCSDLQGKETAQ